MNRIGTLLVPIFILALVLTACEGVFPPAAETAVPTAAATNTPVPTPEPVEETEEPEAPKTVSFDEIQNIEWRWTALSETEPAAQSITPDPENYTLVLWEDNNYNFKADCNAGGGSYTRAGNFITLEPGLTTLAECGPDSLYDQYLALLADVESFGMGEDGLELYLLDEAGTITFEAGDELEKPPVDTACSAGIDPASVTVDPTSFPYAYQPECVPGSDYDDSQPPVAVGLPDHIQVKFTNEDGETQPDDPVIYIIPVSEYLEIWEAAEDKTLASSMDELTELLGEKPEPIPTPGLPILPYEEVAGSADLKVQAAYLDILSGSGVRFVSRFASDPNPITNDNPPLFYTFQGLSSDGQYLITFFYPVTTPFLPAEEEVSDEEQERADSEYPLYFQEVTAELNGLDPNNWEPDLTKLDGLITSLQYGVIREGGEAPPSDITYINWQWGQLIDNNPSTFDLIPDPQNYTIVFNSNGTLSYVADCNSGEGEFTTTGTQITIDLGAATLADCGTTSFSSLFTTLLGEAVSYFVQANSLTLDLAGDQGRMIFLSGGTQIVLPTPSADTPTATAKDAINIRSGPGTEYLTYGVVPEGTNFEVTGVSEDGGWWVVKIPQEIALDEQGWVSADFVDTVNTTQVPVESTPSLDLVEVPRPVSSAMTATFVQSTKVYRGPGTEYASYGVVAVSTPAEVVGISEDGEWWVIAVAEEVTPDKQAWVDANYVQITNRREKPVIPTPPLQ